MLLLSHGHWRYQVMQRLGLVALQDWVNGAWYLLPSDSRCACCTRRHSSRAPLCLDHTWSRRGTTRSSYFLTLLCQRCNSKKGGLPYVPNRPGGRWYPGMPARGRPS